MPSTGFDNAAIALLRFQSKLCAVAYVSMFDIAVALHLCDTSCLRHMAPGSVQCRAILHFCLTLADCKVHHTLAYLISHR